jgi:excinuclease ABC A subunit
VSKAFIRIGGAREHNLKNLTLDIPRDKLVVITGLSGSGKSSLAFDTIYAEGQRKYVESLSAYARQFLDQMQKPDVDFIEGLSPAIAIEQRSSGSSPRSIIATTTEIYDYLRLLYAHVGQPYCPETGVPIVRQTTSDIVDRILALPPRTRVMLLAPVVRDEKGEFRDVVERLAREGFVRARVDGVLVELTSDVRIKLDPKEKHTIEAVVDRLVIDEKIRVRLSDSVETALRWGQGVLLALHQVPETESKVQSPKSKAGNQEAVVSIQNAGPAAITQHATRNTQHAWIETLHSTRNGQELRAADAQTFLLQCSRRRVPGLPWAGSEAGLRREPRGAQPGQVARSRRHSAVAAGRQAHDSLLQGPPAWRHEPLPTEHGSALHGAPGGF